MDNLKKRSAFYGIGKDILIVVIGVLIIWMGLRVAFGTENPFYVVSSGSMEPELNVFDVIVIQGNDPFDEIKKGDIIVFDRPSGHDRVIVHRVVDIIDNEPLTIRTKGDSNPASIPGTDFPITDEEYIGKVVYVIPQIGFITRILTPPLNYIIIAVIVGIMIIKQISKNKKSSSESVFSQSKPNDGDESSTVEHTPKISTFTSDEFNQGLDKEYTKTQVEKNLEPKDSEEKN